MSIKINLNFFLNSIENENIENNEYEFVLTVINIAD